jgi:hypothetical protein
MLFGERFPIISGKPRTRSTRAVIADEYTGLEAISSGVVISYKDYLHDKEKI